MKKVIEKAIVEWLKEYNYLFSAQEITGLADMIDEKVSDETAPLKRKAMDSLLTAERYAKLMKENEELREKLNDKEGY